MVLKVTIQKEGYYILRQTFRNDELRLRVRGNNTPLGGHSYRSLEPDSFWAYPVRNTAPRCVYHAEHVLTPSDLEVTEICGQHLDGVPHTLVTVGRCNVCGQDVRVAWGLTNWPHQLQRDTSGLFAYAFCA
jgi:hypothetical protein